MKVFAKFNIRVGVNEDIRFYYSSIKQLRDQTEYNGDYSVLVNQPFLPFNASSYEPVVLIGLFPQGYTDPTACLNPLAGGRSDCNGF